MMNILRLRSYFEPENVAPSHLSDDMDDLYEQNDIHVLNYTPAPSRGISDEVRREYKKRKHELLRNGHVEVYRFSMFKEGRHSLVRAFRYLCCNLIEYRKGIHTRGIDLVHAGSTPPTLGMVSALVAKKLSKKYDHKVPFVYNLQDIFPDSLVNAGMTKEGSLIWKMGRRIENYTYKNADKIIVISEGFKKNIMAKGVPEEKIEIVPNWVDSEHVKPVSKEENKLYSEYEIDQNKFTVVYAGNLGKMQDGDVIIDAAKQLQNQTEVQFVIFGGGSQFERIKELSENMSNVIIHNLLPQDRVSEVYSLGDVNLITCKSGTGSAGLPSKVWSMMCCGKPIIASFDIDSDLDVLLKNSHAGYCTKPGDATSLAEAITDVMEHSDKYDLVKIRQYAIDNASKEICSKKYLDVLLNAYHMGNGENL